MAEANTNPVFQIQRLYLKDLSLEQPNSPQILLEQQQPQVDINLALSAENISRRHLRGLRHRHRDDQGRRQARCSWSRPSRPASSRSATCRNEQMQGVVSVVCPQILYPYLRAIVSDVCTRAGFPPILLTEVNFQAMYEAQQAQAAQGSGPGGNGSGIITSAA